MGNTIIVILRKMYPPRLLMMGWIYFLLLSIAPLNAAFEFKPPAARPTGMGGAFTGLANDLNAIDYNPAGLRLLPGFEFASTYTDLYGVDGLNYTQLKLAYPLEGYGTFGLQYSDFGPPEYKERTFVFSQGFGLAEGIMFGYNLKSMSVKIQEYGSDTAFGLDTSVLARISDDIGLGAMAKNINEPTISKGSEKIDQEFLTGLYYRPLQGLNFALDVQKVIDRQISLHVGTEFLITDFLALRTGLSTDPADYSFGVGVNYDIFSFDYSYLSNATLSGLHEVTLSVRFGGEQEASLKFTPKAGKNKGPKVSHRRAAAVGAGAEVEEPEGLAGAKVNINTASEEELAGLPSVSKSLAKAIKEYREAHGPFKSIEDIQNVPRLSKRTYSKIEGSITVGEAENSQEETPPAAPETPAIVPEPSTPAVPAVVPAPKAQPQEKQKAKETAPSKKTQEESAAPKKMESEKININRASLPQLLDLGFTTTQSDSILKYIRENGPFKSVDDLKKVPGISEDIVSEVRDNITAK